MSKNPLLSVIVPVYNDPEGLRDTLNSLMQQRDPPPYEVIIVDNDSTDVTSSVIDTFEDDYPDVVIGDKETDVQSSYAARNTGIENASGEILAFIDADVTVEDTWAMDVYNRFQGTNIDYLGFCVEMDLPKGGNTFWARYDYSMGLPVKHYLETKQFAPTCALAVRRTVLDQVGRFDHRLVSGGDKEFGNRVDHGGFKMEYAAGITVQHPTRTTFNSHIAKAKRIGAGQFQLWKKYHLAAHPLSPVRFLPPNILRIRNRKREGDSVILIYMISYLLKIVQSLTAIRLYLLYRLGVLDE